MVGFNIERNQQPNASPLPPQGDFIERDAIDPELSWGTVFLKGIVPPEALDVRPLHDIITGNKPKTR